MRRLKKSKNSISRDLENCFGFNENDVDLSIWNNSSVINSTMAPVDFQTDKPYRLALYVRPSHRRKVNVTNAFTLLKNASQKSSGKKNGSTVNSRIKSRSSLQNKRKAKDVNSVMLFDENVKPENETKKQEKTPDKMQHESNSILKLLNSSRKKVLTEVNSKPLPKTKQCKVRRSYERKCKEKQPEIRVERPSNEIIKELEIKQLTKTKSKKTTKEELEFEKWASDLKSDFNDVDKFELSITYD